MSIATGVLPEIVVSMESAKRSLDEAEKSLRLQFDFDLKAWESESEVLVARLDMVDAAVLALDVARNFIKSAESCIENANKLGERLQEREEGE